jgi:hypothetical protein
VTVAEIRFRACLTAHQSIQSVSRRSAFAPLRANADTTLTVTRALAIKTLMPASEVVSAFAQRGAKADLQKCYAGAAV